MNMLFYIITIINSVYTYGIAAVIEVLGFVFVIWQRKNEYLKPLVKIIICTIIFFVLLGLFEKLCLREVPDVMQMDYNAAKKELNQADLKSEGDIEDVEYIVVKQTPKAGSIVLKNSKIRLKFQDIMEFESEEAQKLSGKMIKRLRNEEVEFGRIVFTFDRLQVATVDDDMKKRDCIGETLSEIEGMKIRFIRGKDTYAPEFAIINDYSIMRNYSGREGTSYVFDNMPYGEYEVLIRSDEYEERKINFTFDENLEDQTINVSLVGKDAGQFLLSRICILDKYMNPVNCAHYNLRCHGETVWRNTQSEEYFGQSSFIIYAYAGAEIDVHVELNDGSILEGIVNINRPVEDLYMVTNNGRLTQISQEEYMSRL